MSISEIIVSEHDSAERQQLHLINCKLEESRSSHPIDQYFTSQLQFNNNNNSNHNGATNKRGTSGQLKASFRGRPLNGKKVQLPEGFTFAQVNKSENKGQLAASDLTREVTYWNLDKLPSADDVVPQMLQWLQLSTSIHAHVSQDD